MQLYDLMLMVFKYQVVNCSSPQDILLVTLNHLDAIKDCARPYLDLTNKVKNLYSVLVSVSILSFFIIVILFIAIIYKSFYIFRIIMI